MVQQCPRFVERIAIRCGRKNFLLITSVLLRFSCNYGSMSERKPEVVMIDKQMRYNNWLIICCHGFVGGLLKQYDLISCNDDRYDMITTQAICRFVAPQQWLSALEVHFQPILDYEMICVQGVNQSEAMLENPYKITLNLTCICPSNSGPSW